MLALLLSAVKNNGVYIFVAAAIAAIMATISLQHLEITHLKNKMAQCKAEAASLVTSNHKLIASIRGQNAAIDAMKEQSDARASAAANRLSMARVSAKQHVLHAEEIETQPTTANDCADMRQLLDKFVQ
jgi:uncharacterized protein YhbP (UPF0306 family)